MLICLHGMLLDHRLFAPQLAGLSDRMQVVAYDQRSRDERGTSCYDLRDLARDCALLIRSMTHEPVVLAGMSLGGLIALRLALDHGELVRGLVLIATPELPEPPADRERLRTAFGSVRHRQSLPAEFARSEAAGHFSAWTRRAHPELVEQMTETISGRTGRVAWREVTSWLDEDNLTRSLDSRHLPVLIVHGDDDRLVPVERAWAMRQELPGSQLLVVPYAGHAVNVEAPEVVNYAIAEFVASLTERLHQIA